MNRPYRCRGSYKLGTACGNVDLPEGVKECVRCTERKYDAEARQAAIDAEAERVKTLPGDRVKKTK